MSRPPAMMSHMCIIMFVLFKGCCSVKYITKLVCKKLTNFASGTKVLCCEQSKTLTPNTTVFFAICQEGKLFLCASCSGKFHQCISCEDVLKYYQKICCYQWLTKWSRKLLENSKSRGSEKRPVESIPSPHINDTTVDRHVKIYMWLMAIQI